MASFRKPAAPCHGPRQRPRQRRPDRHRPSQPTAASWRARHRKAALPLHVPGAGFARPYLRLRSGALWMTLGDVRSRRKRLHTRNIT